MWTIVENISLMQMGYEISDVIQCHPTVYFFFLYKLSVKSVFQVMQVRGTGPMWNN